LNILDFIPNPEVFDPALLASAAKSSAPAALPSENPDAFMSEPNK